MASRNAASARAASALPRVAASRQTLPQRSTNFQRSVVAPQPRPQVFRNPSAMSYADRSPPQAPRYSSARPTQNANPPSVARAPLIRAPQPHDSRSPTHFSGPAARPSNDLTVRRPDSPPHGLIHIGADSSRWNALDGPFNYAHRGYGRRFGPPYPYGHYYYNYPSIYYPGYSYYAPFYGYSYATVYLAEPYVAPVYYDTATYAGPAYTQPVEVAEASPGQPSALPAPPAAAENYQALASQPPQQASSDVSQGNGAFAAGRYEEARDLYVRAVLTDERDGYAKMLFAWSNFALGDYDVAAAAIRRALLTTSDLVKYPMDARTLYSDPAVLDRQMDGLVRFLADHPSHRDAQLVWGYLLYSIGQADRAASVFNGLADADANDEVMSRLREAAVQAARGRSSPSTP